MVLYEYKQTSSLLHHAKNACGDLIVWCRWYIYIVFQLPNKNVYLVFIVWLSSLLFLCFVLSAYLLYLFFQFGNELRKNWIDSFHKVQLLYTVVFFNLIIQLKFIDELGNSINAQKKSEFTTFFKRFFHLQTPTYAKLDSKQLQFYQKHLLLFVHFFLYF